MAKRIPKPSSIRAMMYMATGKLLTTIPPSSGNLGLTVLSKSLQKSANDHNDRSGKDRHASSISLAQPWSDGNGANGA